MAIKAFQSIAQAVGSLANTKAEPVSLWSATALTIATGTPYVSPDIDASLAVQVLMCCTITSIVATPSLQWTLYVKDINGHYNLVGGPTTAQTAVGSVANPILTAGYLLTGLLQLQGTVTGAAASATLDASLEGR